MLYLTRLDTLLGVFDPQEEAMAAAQALPTASNG